MDFLSLNTALSYGILDLDVYESLPKTCSYCESELLVSENLKHFRCSNDKCPGHFAAKLENFFEEFQIKGFGRAKCEDIIINNGLTEIYQIFILTPEQMCSWNNPDVKYEDWLKIRSITLGVYPLWKVIKSLGLYRIDNLAKDIFMSYDNIVKFYEDLMEHGESLIAQKIGKKEGKLSYIIYEELLNNLGAVVNALRFFNIQPAIQKVIKIAITGGVNGWGSKDEFVAYLNGLAKGKFYIDRADSVTKATEVVIAESPSGSSKYRKAIQYGIPIMSSLEFEQYIKSLL